LTRHGPRSSLLAALAALAIACGAPARVFETSAPPASNRADEATIRRDAAWSATTKSPEAATPPSMFFDPPPSAARREAFARAVVAAAARFDRDEIELGIRELEHATKDLPELPLPAKQYPKGFERDVTVVRELTAALREALRSGGGGVAMMDAIRPVLGDVDVRPFEAPLVAYTMKLLERETKTAPPVEACESAVRWLEGLALADGKVPPYAGELHRRFRHRLVCNQPCDAPRPNC
jgi:hypothetical protein